MYVCIIKLYLNAYRHTRDMLYVFHGWMNMNEKCYVSYPDNLDNTNSFIEEKTWIWSSIFLIYLNSLASNKSMYTSLDLWSHRFQMFLNLVLELLVVKEKFLTDFHYLSCFCVSPFLNYISHRSQAQWCWEGKMEARRKSLCIFRNPQSGNCQRFNHGTSCYSSNLFILIA